MMLLNNKNRLAEFCTGIDMDHVRSKVESLKPSA